MSRSYREPPAAGYDGEDWGAPRGTVRFSHTRLAATAPSEADMLRVLTKRQWGILEDCLDARVDELMRLGSGSVSREYWGQLIELALIVRKAQGKLASVFDRD